IPHDVRHSHSHQVQDHHQGFEGEKGNCGEGESRGATLASGNANEKNRKQDVGEEEEGSDEEEEEEEVERHGEEENREEDEAAEAATCKWANLNMVTFGQSPSSQPTLGNTPTDDTSCPLPDQNHNMNLKQGWNKETFLRPCFFFFFLFKLKYKYIEPSQQILGRYNLPIKTGQCKCKNDTVALDCTLNGCCNLRVPFYIGVLCLKN
ncbi:hypothetical protein DBR06_SOUSAS33510010, partial [Sousa chinensis]